MSWWLKIWNSSIGTKTIMALTGLLLTLFVLVHMVGNLQIYLGPEPLNAYAHFLQGLAELLWVARTILIVLVVLHIISAIRVSWLNRVARPDRYVKHEPVKVGWAGRTLIYTGTVIGLFVVYHLLHFTLGVTDPEHFSLLDEHGEKHVYNMVVYGFRDPIVAGGYILATILLGLHFWHGVSSWLQTLGLNSRRYQSLIDRIGPAVGTVVMIGNISIPLTILLRLVNPAGGGE